MDIQNRVVWYASLNLFVTVSSTSFVLTVLLNLFIIAHFVDVFDCITYWKATHARGTIQSFNSYNCL